MTVHILSDEFSSFKSMLLKRFGLKHSLSKSPYQSIVVFDLVLWLYKQKHYKITNSDSFLGLQAEIRNNKDKKYQQ